MLFLLEEVSMSETSPVILVIEDDAAIQKFLRVTLTSQGHQLVEATTGKAGLLEAASRQPDLVILDLGLPDMDGVELVKQLREWSAVPVIVVSARGKEQDKIVALDAGADDYLTKPFGVGELLARVRVALRHAATVDADTGDPTFTVGELHVDLLHRRVTVAKGEVHLTPNEFKLLTVMVKHAGMVMTHRQLLKEVWGPGTGNETHYLRVYMNQLRQKLEQDPTRPRYLLTEPGVGYRLAAEV
ncbi:MAG: two component transcriptional regulator, winged helix family [Phycisphaerales bacterium]|nr:two component transcriptional regulator, winged helix family [Phycisphaerales bacterium]MDB5354625.1 two component transcriptional regulator, winged helix family [Phycisphaerales bacterium]